MTVLTSSTRPRPPSQEEAAPARRIVPPVLRHPSMLGLLAAVSTLVPVVLIAMVSAATDRRTSVSATTASEIGAMAWLALHGTGVVAGDTSLNVVPLLLVVLPVAAAFGTARLVLTGAAERTARLTATLGQWWLGYAVGVALALALTVSGPAHPIGWRLVLAPVLVPGLGLAWALAWIDDDDRPAELDALLARIPISVRRAFGPSVRGVGTLLATGALAVLTLVVLHRERVLAVHHALDPQGVGATVLVLLQLAALPNLAIWAVSFAVGTGVEVVDGASLTWEGAHSGLLPLIPIYGALPQPGAFGWFTVLVILVPVAVGTRIGNRALKHLPRLSAMGSKAKTAAMASGLTAVLIGALTLLGGWSLGTYRLAQIGPPVHWLVPALASELFVGAMLAVLWDGWRLRR